MIQKCSYKTEETFTPLYSLFKSVSGVRFGPKLSQSSKSMTFSYQFFLYILVRFKVHRYVSFWCQFKSEPILAQIWHPGNCLTHGCQVWHQSKPDWPETGQIWEFLKSVIFWLCTETDLKFVPLWAICPIWGQSDLIWGPTWVPRANTRWLRRLS